MNFTKEQISKAMAAKSAEELLELAKAADIVMSDEEAAKYFTELHREGVLAVDELDNVAGGDCDPRPEPDPLFNPGEMLLLRRYTEMQNVIVMERLEFNRLLFEWFYKVYNTTTGEIMDVKEVFLSRP